MTRLLIFLALVGVTGQRPAQWPIAGGGYVLSTGYPLGMLGLNVCTAVADDVTPDLIGAAAGGCNILETSAFNTGATAITDLDNPLVGAIVYIVGTGGANTTTIADAGNFNLEAGWTGTADNILVLYVQADNDYVEITRHNGPRYFDGAVTLGGNLDAADNSILNPLDGIYGEAPITDTDPDDILIHAEHSYSQGAQTGSNLVLSGGSDEKYFTSTDYANGANDTYGITVGYCTAGVCAVAAVVTRTEGVDWTAATDDATTACTIYDDLISNPVPGVVAGRTDATCSDAKVFLQPNDANTYYVLLAATDAGGGGVWGTATNGTDGQVLVPLGASAAPGLAFFGDPDSGLIYESNSLYIVHNTGRIARFQTGGHVTLGEPLYLNAADEIAWTGQGGLRSPADNQTQFCNAAQTQCFTLGASAAGTMTIWDGAGTGGASVTHVVAAGGKLYLDATTTKHTQTAGVLDINMAIADGTAGGQVAIDVSSTTPAEGLSGGETQYAISASITGDAQDNATSSHIVNQVAYTPNGGGGTSYGYYAADTDFDYGFYTTAPSRFADIDAYDGSGNGAFWRAFHIPASKVEPAAAGATPTVINTATFVYLLNANTEYLYFGTDIHDDWDASSDIVVRVTVALSGAEVANDIINAEIVAEYVGDHEDMDTGIKTQTRTINHDIVSDNGQGAVHHMTFVLDHDLVSHVIQVGDDLSLRFRLDSVGGGTDVAAVWFKSANIKYRTSKPQLETGGTFPSEG